MAAQCLVVVNAVGPYRFYGESVVKACLAEGTSHVDISGELQFLERMEVEYGEEARAKGVYIVGACGYDSIPADLGVTHLEKNFEGEINSIETYARMTVKDFRKGGGMNTGTWYSAIHYLANLGELKDIRSKLYTKMVPKPKYKAAKRWPLHYNEESKKWCTPFIGVDEKIVERSQYHFYTEEHKRPVQYHAYHQQPYLLVCFGLAFVGFITYVLSQFKFGLKLLEKYPKIITFGLVKPEGPTREQAENTVCTFHMAASGWSEKLSSPTDQHASPPNKKMKLVIKFSNPGYRSTAAMFLQSAVVIVQERDKLPKKGGVYPPGFAFGKTTLIDRIQRRGIEVKINGDN